MENEIVLSGPVSESEINEIRSFISESKVSKMKTKAFDPIELIQIIFNDFSVYDFTRDFILSELIVGRLKELKSVFEYFKDKKKPVDVASIVIEIKKGNSTVILTILSKPENLDLTIDLVNQNIEIILNDVQGIRHIDVKLSDNGSDLQIDKM